MDKDAIDFEGTGATGTDGQAGNGTQGGAANNGGTNGNGDAVDINGGGNDDITGKDGTNGNGSDNGNNGNNGDGNQGGNGTEGNGGTDNNGNGGANGDGKGSDADNSSTGELVAGTQLEVDGETYTVGDNGDILDKDGNVFKTAAESKDWLASFEQEPDNNLDINAIQEAIGIEVTDEDGKPVEFTNDADGIKAYINKVVDLQRQEIADGAINKLYSDNPLLKQFQDYVQVNGTYQGFGELPDRSAWEVSKDNENQQEAIVRMAAKEFGNLSLNDNYIKYLKDTGGLYDEAVNQLKALQQKDVEVRNNIAQQAEAARKQEEQELTAYWNKVNDVINSGNIAGYKLPASFVKEVNGQKQTLTPKDFFNYLSRHTEVDANGNKITAYQKDLAKESDDEYMNRELISAWLMYTVGTYKDLVDMAVKEQEVRVLKLKAKQNGTKKTVKFVKPQGKVDANDILLG